MKTFLISLLDWIYKKKCYFCKSSKTGIKMCPDCYEELEHLSSEQTREILGCKVFYAGVYEQALQKLIRGVKYHNQKDLAYFQAKFMFDFWKNLDQSEQDFQIIPVPLFKSRQKQRKYNHMELVAQEFSKLSGYDVNSQLVVRVKDTKPQYKLSRTQRMQNLSNAFKVNKNSIKQGKILIMDDICTTGSTFENIILNLKNEGINDIVCFATSGVN